MGGLGEGGRGAGWGWGSSPLFFIFCFSFCPSTVGWEARRTHEEALLSPGCEGAARLLGQIFCMIKSGLEPGRTVDEGPIKWSPLGQTDVRGLRKRSTTTTTTTCHML